MKLENFKGAIFDMDGTLINSLIIWKVVWREFGNKFLDGKEFNISEADDKKVRTMTLKDAMYYVHSTYNLGESGDAVHEEAVRIIKDFYSDEVETKEGVMEFLEHCYQNGVKMCVASASAVDLLGYAMDHCGIRKYFSDIVSCADLGKGKDHPDVYLKALSVLGTSVDETWVFEDSQVAIETASGLGIRTVGIYDENNYDGEMAEKISTIYIGKGEGLDKLI